MAFLLFEPLEFLERLAAMTPRPETNLLICHGVLAPRARWRARVVVYGRPVPEPTASTAPPASKTLRAGRPPCITVGGGDGDGTPRYRLVTDFLPDTPAVARPYCPDCEPDADPCSEILDVRWCAAHTPAWNGADDAAVRADAFLSGSAEAGGDDNRRWCQLLHNPGHVTASARSGGARRRSGRSAARTATGS